MTKHFPLIFEFLGLQRTPLTELIVMLGLVLCISLVFYLIFNNIIWSLIKRKNEANPKDWLTYLINSKLYGHALLMVLGGIAGNLLRSVAGPDIFFSNILVMISDLWAVTFAMLALLSVINFVNDLATSSAFTKKLPINGITQALRMIIYIIFLVLALSIILGRSPLILLSGLSAMTAILMLVFKDPIMGFVSGIQLSSYNMLAVGDWLEMPKYNADGDVLEIGLTTVKVQNWDKTITTIPTYALISDSFKNWRGMEETGGRRIKRSVFIDISSIHFLSAEEASRLKSAMLISDYLKTKEDELEEYNKALGADTSTCMNGRHLTNVGTFRAYLEKYLRNHPKIHKGLTILVRQMAPTPEGLPIELYVFTNTIAWGEYEAIQSDIFDHIFAILPEFGLRAFQAPTGYDLRNTGQDLGAPPQTPLWTQSPDPEL